MLEMSSDAGLSCRIEWAGGYAAIRHHSELIFKFHSERWITLKWVLKYLLHESRIHLDRLVLVLF